MVYTVLKGRGGRGSARMPNLIHKVGVAGYMGDHLRHSFGILKMESYPGTPFARGGAALDWVWIELLASAPHAAAWNASKTMKRGRN